MGRGIAAEESGRRGAAKQGRGGKVELCRALCNNPPPFTMIQYLGSKRRLVPQILRIVESLPDVRTVVDLFSGSSRVGFALKRAGFFVTSNDHATFAATIAKCSIQANAWKYEQIAQTLIDEFNQLAGKGGWFTEFYCKQSRFFTIMNGAKIEAVREGILQKSLEPELEAILLTSLMEAADRVDSTTGVQAAYLRNYAPRALGDLQLKMPQMFPRDGRSLQMDARRAVDQLEADLMYIDPPYNEHSYLRNYHIWETLCLWDEPYTFGVAKTRQDARTRLSPFNYKDQIAPALEYVINHSKARYLLVSLNDEGFVSSRQMRELLSNHGFVVSVSFKNRRYIGSRIGIYNNEGEKVGRAGKEWNREYLYLAGPDRGRVEQAVASACEDVIVNC